VPVRRRRRFVHEVVVALDAVVESECEVPISSGMGSYAC